MASFKKILFPLNGKPEAVDFAVEIARKSGAKLFLLKAYRLTDKKIKKQPGDKSVKHTLDRMIHEEFERLYLEKLKASGIKFEFMVEIGFLTDRIIAAIKEKDIDMLMLDGLDQKNDDSIIERLNELTVPVMLIPENLPKYVAK